MNLVVTKWHKPLTVILCESSGRVSEDKDHIRILILVELMMQIANRRSPTYLQRSIMNYTNVYLMV